MIYAQQWTLEQFETIKHIAYRHDINCSLRIAMVTRDDNDGKLSCDCNGKLDLFGRPTTTPCEETLAEVLEQLGVDGGAA